MNNGNENEFHTVRGYQLKKQKESGLTPALEDYLEMAYRLCLEDGYTRVNRLSESLNVKPSSTSKMVSRLVGLGYLGYDSFDSIYLTAEGKKTGSFLLERHHTLERFFTLVGSADPLEETELVEHMLLESTVMKIRCLLDYVGQTPGFEKKLVDFIGKCGDD